MHDRLLQLLLQCAHTSLQLDVNTLHFNFRCSGRLLTSIVADARPVALAFYWSHLFGAMRAHFVPPTVGQRSADSSCHRIQGTNSTLAAYDHLPYDRLPNASWLYQSW